MTLRTGIVEVIKKYEGKDLLNKYNEEVREEYKGKKLELDPPILFKLDKEKVKEYDECRLRAIALIRYNKSFLGSIQSAINSYYNKDESKSKEIGNISELTQDTFKIDEDSIKQCIIQPSEILLNINSFFGSVEMM